MPGGRSLRALVARALTRIAGRSDLVSRICATKEAGRRGSIARLIVLLLIVMPAGCGGPGYRPAPTGAARVATVYVIDRGWHTDIGLGADDVRGPLATLEADFPGVRYLVFGFGDRAYLLSPYRSFIDMIAALVPGRGAMLVTALRAP
ncbi:MAG TPA: DUF2459 domain-containing protein, partial [Acetobacteraceae bacterium]|nr:DUF2459 domain-containing protein [Acetobacteraceae bacterium]